MMNNEKIAGYIQNIFHLENITADDDSYNRGSISSNSWGDGITIRWQVGDFGDEKDVIIRYVYSMGTYTISINSRMTSKEASKEIVNLIGRVLITQADTVDPGTGMHNILSWPYNCNLAYVEYLIEALQYGDNPIKNSKKPIKSSDDILDADSEEETEEVTSGCHGKSKKKTKKEIKSSQETWEAGYQAYHNKEGYADYPTGLSNRDSEDWMSGYDYANREDQGEFSENEQQVWTEDDEERLRARYADEHGLDLDEVIIDEDDYNEWIHRGAAMYSSANPLSRNRRNIQKLYNK